MDKQEHRVRQGDAQLKSQREGLLAVIRPICLYCDGPDCNDSANWYEHGALFIDKVPLGLGLWLEIDPSLFGKQLSLSFQIQDKNTSAILFERAWDTTAEFSSQWSWLQWDLTPPEVAALAPGPYKYVGIAFEFDTGEYAEKQRLVFARKKPA